MYFLAIAATAIISFYACDPKKAITDALTSSVSGSDSVLINGTLLNLNGLAYNTRTISATGDTISIANTDAALGTTDTSKMKAVFIYLTSPTAFNVGTYIVSAPIQSVKPIFTYKNNSKYYFSIPTHEDTVVITTLSSSNIAGSFKTVVYSGLSDSLKLSGVFSNHF